MNPQDPLAQLQPLREPELISWWPLAPGWWLLCGLLFLLLLSLTWWLLRRYRANAYRRQALRQLDQLQESFRLDGDSMNTLAAAAMERSEVVWPVARASSAIVSIT